MNVSPQLHGKPELDSLHPRSGEQVPSLTERIARVSDPGGTTAMQAETDWTDCGATRASRGGIRATGVPGSRPPDWPPSACCSSCSAGSVVPAPAHDGFTEQITEGETGLLHPPDLPDALTDALRRALALALAERDQARQSAG